MGEPQLTDSDLLTATVLCASGVSPLQPVFITDEKLIFLNQRFPHATLPTLNSKSLCFKALHKLTPSYSFQSISFWLEKPSFSQRQMSSLSTKPSWSAMLVHSVPLLKKRSSLGFLFPNLPTLKVHLQSCLALQPFPKAFTRMALPSRIP